jgi:hypothetical protein
MRHPSNWIHRVQARGHRLPGYACVTYDFVNDPSHNQFPEPAGFVFWADAPFYNVMGNRQARYLMASPQVVTLAR